MYYSTVWNGQRETGNDDDDDDAWMDGQNSNDGIEGNRRQKTRDPKKVKNECERPKGWRNCEKDAKVGRKGEGPTTKCDHGPKKPTKDYDHEQEHRL